MYYSVFTSQIEDELKNSINKRFNLKEGDIIIITIRNVNLTFSQQMKDAFYIAIGIDINKINTTQSALVIATGSAIE